MLETETEAHSDCIFCAKGAKKWYDDGQVQALRGVDLCIREGEFAAIIGPSGCGKTTLLRLLGALHRPSAGTLLYRGRSIADLRDPSVAPPERCSRLQTRSSHWPAFAIARKPCRSGLRKGWPPSLWRVRITIGIAPSIGGEQASRERVNSRQVYIRAIGVFSQSV